MSVFLHSASESAAFFEALREASVILLRKYGLPIDQGHKRYASWEHGRPIGITEHYTGGVAWQGTVSWLNAGPHKNKSSCQFLVLDRMLSEAKPVYDKYPELRELTVTAFMLSDGIIPCWHAEWVNRLTVGIENRNAGYLLGSAGHWRWWANDWKARFPYERLDKRPCLIHDRWWEPYTRGQIMANVSIGQHLLCLQQDEGGLDPVWFLPHSATCGEKMDIGNAFPFHLVREAVFSGKPLLSLNTLYDFAASKSRVEIYSRADDAGMCEDDSLFLGACAAAGRDRSGYEAVPAVELPPEDYQELIQAGSWREELDVVRESLRQLGYYIPQSCQGTALDVETATATFIFQKSQGGALKVDKVPGDKTQRALYKRLTEFGRTVRSYA